MVNEVPGTSHRGSSSSSVDSQMVESPNHRTKRLVGDKNGETARSWNLTTSFKYLSPLCLRFMDRPKLRKRINQPLGETARWLKRVVQGWLNYHAVPGNSHRIGRFVDEVTRHWLWTIRRRSQRGKSSWTWARMHKLVRRHLPKARMIHPYPEQRFRARLKAKAV